MMFYLRKYISRNLHFKLRRIRHYIMHEMYAYSRISIVIIASLRFLLLHLMISFKNIFIKKYICLGPPFFNLLNLYHFSLTNIMIISNCVLHSTCFYIKKNKYNSANTHFIYLVTYLQMQAFPIKIF